MKTKFNEWSRGLEITIIPETVEEFAMLLRYAINANSDKPYVSLSFTGSPYCYISLNKRKESVQKTGINPNTK